jgi:hypothetical protein
VAELFETCIHGIPSIARSIEYCAPGLLDPAHFNLVGTGTRTTFPNALWRAQETTAIFLMGAGSPPRMPRRAGHACGCHPNPLQNAIARNRPTR